jgi:hypothetical protein
VVGWRCCASARTVVAQRRCAVAVSRPGQNSLWYVLQQRKGVCNLFIMQTVAGHHWRPSGSSGLRRPRVRDTGSAPQYQVQNLLRTGANDRRLWGILDAQNPHERRTCVVFRRHSNRLCSDAIRTTGNLSASVSPAAQRRCRMHSVGGV